MKLLQRSKLDRNEIGLGSALRIGHNLRRPLCITSPPVTRPIPNSAEFPIQQYTSISNQLFAAQSLQQDRNARTQRRAYTSSGAIPNNTSSELPRDEPFDLVTTQVFEIFRESERGFYLHLSGDDLRLLGCVGECPRWWLAANGRSYLEVLLTLKGLKGCTYFSFGTDPECRPILSQLVQTCFKPLFDTHQLMRYGFILYQAEWGEWMFADTRSKQWPHVQNVFIAPTYWCSDGGLGKFPAWTLSMSSPYNVGRALNYPILDHEAELTGVVVYEDPIERDKLSRILKIQVPRLIAHDYKAPGDFKDYLHSRKHFDRYRAAVQSEGVDLSYDISQHKQFTQWEATIKKGIGLMRYNDMSEPEDLDLLYEHLKREFF